MVDKQLPYFYIVYTMILGGSNFCVREFVSYEAQSRRVVTSDFCDLIDLI